MLLGFSLLYVGVVLFINGIWLLGHVDDREIAIVNVFSGFITGAISFYLAFGTGADAASIKAAALTLLFSLTYLWIAYNRFHDVDGRGLGWFSLFVAITTIPVCIQTLSGAVTAWDIWFGLCWAVWGVLWFMYFLLLSLKKPITRITGIVTLASGIFTGWLPGYLLLDGVL